MTADSSKKWGGRLAGCAIGCGLFLLIVILALFSFYRWAFRPGQPIATEAIIGADSAGFVRLQNLATDEGGPPVAARQPEPPGRKSTRTAGNALKHL